MKKHAMLIMAHNQFAVLEKLLIMLDHERNEIYIHIDRKSGHVDEQYYRCLCRRSRIVFIPGMSVHWGNSSQVDCELALMEAALASGEEYCYLHLLSGVDLQIKHTVNDRTGFQSHRNVRSMLFLRGILLKSFVSSPAVRMRCF